MLTKEDLQVVLLRLAACEMDFVEWQDWWVAHAAEVKKIISPGDFSRLNRAPSVYGEKSFLAKCQVGAERYLQKMQIPFCHSEAYELAAAEEKRVYDEQKAAEREAAQREAQVWREHCRRDPEGLPYYRDFIDLLVRQAKKTPYLPPEVQDFTPEQQRLVAEWLQNERYNVLAAVLADLDWQITCNELEFYQHGYKMPYMTYDDLLHDFTCRMEGEDWPKNSTDQ